MNLKDEIFIWPKHYKPIPNPSMLLGVTVTRVDVERAYDVAIHSDLTVMNLVDRLCKELGL